MRKSSNSNRLVSPRIGFHYFEDTGHYTNHDLNTWLPKLISLQAKWIVLRSDASRAIPEQFLSALISSGITPIVHMSLPLPNAPASSDVKALFEAYARWGVKQIILFDKPNSLQSWSASGWSQQDLVERFIDKFVPLALTALQSGLTPIFPPLHPGGNYWDLSFLKQSLQSIIRRGYSSLVQKMGLASEAYTFNHELDWGMGAQSKWPKSRPYAKSEDSQDQCGFYNFEWLQSVAVSVTGREIPVILLGAGIKEPGIGYSPEVHAEVVQNILERLNGIPESKTIPSYVQCCNFFLLASEPDAEEYVHAWFKSDEETLPIVEMLAPEAEKIEQVPQMEEIQPKSTPASSDADSSHPIDHYLLLPQYEWGIAEFHLNASRPFVQKYHPTLGFSIQEAMLAKKVTVVGGESEFPEELLEKLCQNGAEVERISGDGTSIATQLAER